MPTTNNVPDNETAFAHEMHDIHDQLEHPEEDKGSIGCGPMKKYPLLSIISFALVGVGIGLALSFWEPDDEDTKFKVVKWVGLVGDLFIRALKCVILPLVFINVIISVVDMMSVGRAGTIGIKTIGMYLCTTLIASILGLIAVLSMQGLFKQGEVTTRPEATVRLGCNNVDGSFITEMEDGSLMCTATEDDSSSFLIDDLSGHFVASSGGISDNVSLSDTVYEGVFTKLVTDNITLAFAETNFAAVVLFAVIMGVALASVHFKKGGEERNYVLPFLMELDSCFITIIHWIITVTPFAVLSLIASAIGSQTDLVDSNVAYLVVACIFGFIMQFFFVHIGLFFAVTRQNPIPYLQKIIPAQTMAFACASSAATIPMTLKSVRSTGRVPESILKFVVPLGATVNMDGSAIYFPCACIWLATLNNVDINAAHYLLLIVIATIGSMGTAPVPSAGLVLIITAYNTVFGTTGIPDNFSYIVAIDFFLDRCITVVNVTGDAVVCGMIAKLCSEEHPVLPESIQKVVSLEEEDAVSADDSSNTAPAVNECEA